MVKREASLSSRAIIACGTVELETSTGCKSNGLSVKLFKAGKPNIANDSIVNREKIIFLPLHLKLGFMKQFAKALNTESECFQYIVSARPASSFEKFKAVVFNGPQI